MLASAGAKGELYITNLNNPTTDPLRLGTSAARADDFDALDWNKKVPHILVTGSSGGFATVWDIKAKKESINLNNYNRKAISAIAWDPTTATKLATATSYDQEPVILLWDLRNSNAPEKILRHHDQGVLSLSWSIADPRLLLSCGKDNRTVCWNTQTGEPFGEFPIVTNWTFETAWSPRHPDLFATASFDGKIAVQTVQNTNPDTSAATATATLDDNDFFASAQSRPQGASFSLPIAPAWLQRPVSATFGFGGKLVKVSSEGGRSKVSISTFVVDSSIGKASDEFEKTVEQGDYKSFCDTKIADAKSGDEKADWTVIETLISGSRKNLKEYLGFKEEAPKENGDANLHDGDEDFFDKSDDAAFASAWSASKTTKTNDPFKLYTGKESESDKKISRALILGNFEEALDVCLKEKRLSDAFMIAICGGEKCIAKAKAAYFKEASDGPNYLRLLASVSGKNLWDLVYNADLKDWKEVMLALCTYANDTEFPDLCEALGDRLEEIPGEASASHKDASFCYLSGSKLEKVLTLWLQELQESEKSLVDHAEGDSNLFSIHVNALQAFIEKVTIFRNVTRFTDGEKDKEDDWKLAPLYAKYAEYADILASQGQLATAGKYLDLLPTHYPAADVARNRVQHATRRAAVSSQKQAVGGTTRGQRVVPSFQPAAVPGIPAATAVNSMYAPQNSTQPAFNQPAARPAYGGYQPQQQQSYQPQGYQPPAATMPTPQPFASYNNQYGPGVGAVAGVGAGVPPPPRATNQSPALPPASRVSNMEMWNDTPDFGPKNVPRRSTPSVVTAPVAGQTPPGSVPPPPAMGAGSYGVPPPSKTLPPPPKTGLSRTTSPGNAPIIPSIQDQASQAAISRAANTYSPPPGLATQSLQPSIVPRGASPYNPPPPGSHGPNSRYAPAPGTAQLGPPGASPYAARQQPAGAPSYMQPPSTTVRHELPGVTTPVGGPPPGPPPKGIARNMVPPPVSTVGGRGISLPSPQPSTSRPGSRGSNRPEVATNYRKYLALDSVLN
jgi:protein transport protein SEC31